MPCDIIGLSLEDKLGNNIENYYISLNKYRIDKNCYEISAESFE